MPSLRALPAVLTSIATTIALTVGSLAAGTVVAAPASASTAAAPVVTPASARAAMTAVAKVLSKAGETYDVALQSTVEAGAAKAADNADFRISRLVGYDPYKPFRWTGTRVFLTRQTHYPATFLALAHFRWAGSAANKDVVGLVFQKASSKARWRLVGDIGFGGGPVPAFTVGKDGYLPALVPSALMVTPAAMYPALVKAQNVAGRGGRPSAAWANNWLWKNYLSQTKVEAVDTHETFTSSHRAPLCFAATAGAFCLTSTREVRLRTSTPQELAAAEYWTVGSQEQQYEAGGIAQGSYATIRTVAQRQLAVVIPYKKKGAQLSVTAEYWSPLAGKGTLPPVRTG